MVRHPFRLALLWAVLWAAFSFAVEAQTLNGQTPALNSSQSVIKADGTLEYAELYKRACIRDVVVGGSANAISITSPNVAATALTDGLCFTVQLTSSITGAATVALDGLTAKSLRKQDGTAAGSGDANAGPMFTFVYVEADNGAAGGWRIINPVAAGGGGGSPGGTSGQVQYNNAGAFGGFTLSGDATLTPSTGVIEVTQSDALEANGANCGGGQWAAGVDTAGAAEGCTADDDVPESGDYGNLSATSPITQSAGTISTSISTNRLMGRSTAATGVMEQITPDATLSLAAGALGVVDVTCTGCLGVTEIAGLDTADTTTGTFADGRIDGSLEADEVNPTLGTQTQGNYAAGDAEAGAALTGDTATSFFSAGTIEAARGGTGDDTSALTGVPRLASGNWTYDAAISHLQASTSADLAGILSDETGSGGGFVRATSPTITTPTFNTSVAAMGDTIDDFTGFGLTLSSADLGLLQTGALDGECLVFESTGPTIDWVTCGGGGGSGDVVGPASATDNAIARFDTATGKLIQNSGVLISDGNEVDLPLQASPTAPAADRVKIFAGKSGGRLMPMFVGPNGQRTTVQPSIGKNKVLHISAAGNNTTITAWGAGAPTSTGTATAVNVAQTNAATRIRRLEYLVTTAATTAVSGFRHTNAQWTVGDPSLAEFGGFHFVCVWGTATGGATSTHRAFVGMANTTAAPTDVEPSSITNIAGMGWDAADTNIKIMHRGAGAVTKIDLGSNFPVPSADRADAYMLELYSPPGTTQKVGYKVTNITTGNVAEGEITSNMPSTATYLAPRGWMSVGGTSSVIGIALSQFYVESDW